MDEQANDIEGIGRGLIELHRFFTAHRWKYCIVGGLAATRWGEPLFTKDNGHDE